MMKRLLLLMVIFIVTNMCVFAQVFDDLPYSNPDLTTYFQQEMKSLFSFMDNNKINIPVYVSFSGKTLEGSYNSPYYADFLAGYLDQYHGNESGTDYYLFDRGDDRNILDIHILGGGNIKINNMFSIPLFFVYGGTRNSNIAEFELLYNGRKVPLKGAITEYNTELYFGSGLFIATDIIKGGILLGLNHKMYELDIPTYVDNHAIDSTYTPLSFRVELLPLVNTSSWRTVGKVLNNVFGYLGVGTVISSPEEDTGIINTVANTVNAALDFTFNRIHWGVLNLDLQAMYDRGYYDAASKANTYGMRVQGVFTGFPLGFGFEGGYKQFFYIFEPFLPYYDNTIYVKGSLFIPLKNFTFGVIYNYDDIYKSQFTFALSTNFLSGFLGINNSNPDNEKYRSFTVAEYGARFRWGGWKANKQ